MVKLRYLNCSDAVSYFAENGVEKALASRKEVFETFKRMGGSVPVKKFGSVSKHREGELFSVDARPLRNGMNRGFYGVRKIPGQKGFAKRGDSGSLVCMKCKDGRKVPFAYACSRHKGVYYCPNLKFSLEALNPDMKPCLRECTFN